MATGCLGNLLQMYESRLTRCSIAARARSDMKRLQSPSLPGRAASVAAARQRCAAPARSWSLVCIPRIPLRTVAGVMRSGRMEWLVRLGGSFSWYHRKSGEVELGLPRRPTPDSGRSVPAGNARALAVPRSPSMARQSTSQPPTRTLATPRPRPSRLLQTFWNSAPAEWQLPHSPTLPPALTGAQPAWPGPL